MSSFSSDQTTLNKTTGAASVLLGARARVTSIQGRGEAGSVLSLHDVADAGDAAAGNLKAIYRYETEGLEVYIPGSGISFSYTHLRAHETGRNLVCRLLLEKKKHVQILSLIHNS